MATLITTASQAVELLYPRTDARRSTIDALTRMERYFERGGDFYHALERESDVVDWCLQVRRHALRDIVLLYSLAFVLARPPPPHRTRPLTPYLPYPRTRQRGDR